MRGQHNPISELLALHAASRFAQMERRARQLLKDVPQSAILNELLGVALAAQQRHAQALPFLQKAARSAPTDPQFWENLALCQRQLGQFEQAETSLRTSLALRPASVETLNALGVVLRSLGKDAQARSAFEQALTAGPNHLAANINLAKMLSEQRRLKEADHYLRRAMAILQAGMPEISDQTISLWDTVASVLDNLACAGEATAIYKKTLAFRMTPSRALAAILPARNVCDWEFASTVEALARGALQTKALDGAGSPAPFLFITSAAPADQLALARIHSRAIAPRTAPGRRPTRPTAKTRLRIGYLSSEFHNHATAHLLIGVLEAHDRTRFEIVGYDYSPETSSSDPYRRRCLDAFDSHVQIREIPDDAAAKRLVEDGVDIAVDLKGWTIGARAGVLVSRPAPLQVQWLGYPGTMGAPWIDYIVADHVLIQPGEEGNYSEKVIRLPHSYQPNDPHRAIPARGNRSEHALPSDAFVFCSFNATNKITAEIFELWMKLLAAVDNSVLWLLPSSSEAAESLRRRAISQGIESERLIFASLKAPDEHIARVASADLALDCFPCGSHTTASDMLRAGVPLIALKGDTFASRVSASVLSAAGLPELITTSFNDFFDLALRLACNQPELQALRSRVTHARLTAPLFDSDRFARHFEAALTTAWERHVAGLPPDHIAVG
jgi:protein O-GlcNAc transferase